MFIRAKPDSLSVVMVVGNYPLTTFKMLFARSLLLPVVVNGYEFIAFKIDFIYFIFLHVFDVSCFNLGGSIEAPEPPPRST